MKILFAVAISFAAAQAAASASFQESAQPAMPAHAAHPALYSFADIYRLTVGGAPMPEAPTPELPMRVAAVQAAPPAELQFSVMRLPEPRGWMLLLAGLALAGWVARRRLGYSF
ncbi:MAG TPA: hypothetical protein VHG88_02265 [Burkholderiales bacterium]|nr:hypothetical protein [Burkholderiales bacterium]